MTDVRAFRETTHGDEYVFRFEETDSGIVVQVLSHPKIPNGITAVETHLMLGNKLDLPMTPTTLENAIRCVCCWMAHLSDCIRFRVTDQLGAKKESVE
jgi:hypothetical protein